MELADKQEKINSLQVNNLMYKFNLYLTSVCVTMYVSIADLYVPLYVLITFVI